MTWNKSKDGGWDYQVKPEIQNNNDYNAFSSGYTSTQIFDFHPIPEPSLKERIKDRIKNRRNNYQYNERII